MAIITPVGGNTSISLGTPVEIYSCPANATHAYIDLSAYKEDDASTILMGYALTTESNPANLTSVDFFIDDIEMIGTTNSHELSKVIVGTGQRLYAAVFSGSSLNIRFTGIQEAPISNTVASRVLNAGRLAAGAVTTTGTTQIFNNNIPNTSYAYMSVTLYNLDTEKNSQAEAWISTSATPLATDKQMKISIPPTDTTILENIMLLPNERLFVKTSTGNMEYFANGMVMSN